MTNQISMPVLHTPTKAPIATAVHWRRASAALRDIKELARDLDAFSVLLLVVGIVAACLVTVWVRDLPQHQRRADAAVQHTLQVLAVAEQLNAHLVTVASEGRGFMIDQTATSKDRFEAAAKIVATDIQTIRGLTADNPIQQFTLDRMEPLIASRVQVLRDIIARLEAGDRVGAMALVNTQRGRALMDRLLIEVEEVRAQERRLLASRSKQAEIATRGDVIGLTGCATLIAACTVLMVALQMGRRRQRKHVVQLSGMNADLEDRVAARTAELAAREALFRVLTESSADVVSLVAADGSRQYMSPIGERVFGRPLDRLLTHSLAEFIHPDDRTSLEALQNRLVAGGVEEDKVTFRILNPERGIVWAEAYARSVRDGATGAPDGYVSVTRDITERRMAEEANALNEARYRLLADNSSDVIKCVDMEFRILYVSPSLRAMLGYEPEELVGSPLFGCMHPEDASRIQPIVRPMLAGTSDRTSAIYRSQHKLGHWIWVEATIGVARNPATDEPASLIFSLRDITDRKRQADELSAANAQLESLTRHLTRALDQAEQASMAKSKFLAGMTHELRTPLNGILGYAQLLQIEGALSERQLGMLNAMLGAGQHLLEMINGVLDLSEIEAGKAELNTTDVDLRHVVGGCVDLIRPSALAKGLGARIEIDPNVAARANVDATRLRQILLNLLGNSVKFTVAGEIVMKVSAIAATDSLRFEVIDTGPGIPAAQKPRLFTEFMRVETSLKMDVEGAGLGLALSARLAAMMGGKLQHENNPEGGSIFSFELPQSSIVSSPPLADGIETAVQPSPVKKARRVLLTDDVLMNRDIASSILTSAGHDVTCAESGAEAVALASEQDFDVILMDVRMPGMNGLEATRLIRNLIGPRARIPIIALTAQAFAEQVEECRRAGMDAHLSKPFNYAELIKTVETVRSHDENPLVRHATSLSDVAPAMARNAHLTAPA